MYTLLILIHFNKKKRYFVLNSILTNQMLKAKTYVISITSAILC